MLGSLLLPRCLSFPLLLCYLVTLLLCSLVTLLPCYSVSLLPCCFVLLLLSVTLLLCSALLLCCLVTLLFCSLVTLFPCYSVTLLLCFLVTLFPCYLVTLLVCSLVTLLLCCPVPLLLCSLVTLFPFYIVTLLPINRGSTVAKAVVNSANFNEDMTVAVVTACGNLTLNWSAPRDRALSIAPLYIKRYLSCTIHSGAKRRHLLHGHQDRVMFTPACVHPPLPSSSPPPPLRKIKFKKRGRKFFIVGWYRATVI